MKPHEAEKLIETIRGFIETEKGTPAKGPDKKGEAKAAPIPLITPPKVSNGGQFDVRKVAGTASTVSGDVATQFASPDTEALYQAFKLRFIEEATIDPMLLHLIMSRPELIVDVERKTLRLDDSSAKGRMARLLARGFFDETKGAGVVRKELGRTGSDPGGGGTLYNPLNDLVKEGFLTKEGDGFRRAPGVKVSERQVETAGVGD